MTLVNILIKACPLSEKFLKDSKYYFVDVTNHEMLMTQRLWEFMKRESFFTFMQILSVFQVNVHCAYLVSFSISYFNL